MSPREFVAMTGHDLKNDLAVLSINAELMQRNAGNLPPEKYQAALRSIQRTLVHMDHLVSDLLDLTRIDVGKLSVKPEVRDAIPVVRESIESFRPLAEAKSVSLRELLPDSPLPARIDPPRIRQVLSNLLGNAIKFSPTKGEVRVEARRENSFVTVEVCDFGRGIPEPELEAIFERYTQLHGSDGEGLGLGLYIARWIVDAHGGRIWARSRVGQGSTFGFRVPGASA